MSEIDWSECPLVETKPHVQGGRPVLTKTRMPVQDIVDNWEAGVDEQEIARQFQLPIQQVRDVLAYAARHQNDPYPV